MFLKTFHLMCNPVKGLEYLEAYFDIVQQISQQKSNKIKLLFRLSFAIITYKCVHFLTLGVISKNFTNFQRTIHYQGLYLLMPKYRFSFLSGLVAVSLLFYNYVLFTRPHTEMNDLLKTILIDDSKSQKFINENRYFLYKVYCGRNVLQFIRRFCLKVLNTFASLILVSSKSF